MSGQEWAFVAFMLCLSASVMWFLFMLLDTHDKVVQIHKWLKDDDK